MKDPHPRSCARVPAPYQHWTARSQRAGVEGLRDQLSLGQAPRHARSKVSSMPVWSSPAKWLEPNTMSTGRLEVDAIPWVWARMLPWPTRSHG